MTSINHTRMTSAGGPTDGRRSGEHVQGALHIIALNEQISFLDINAACPIPKIIKKKAGLLVKEPEKLYSIIDKLATKLPLRSRSTPDRLPEKDVGRTVKIARGCEQSGRRRSLSTAGR